ncbi:hypothetical protein TOI97_13150 [Denitrificimonas sp. JX-1]|uniref:Uncharacterized protein n=1 Tax=Denitrificimonas halotolerans TaxID=3098930 RepID=A0ABU5GUE9_9GAMM|nr:hypothetical protein [Denitrificimonas sp. JX-1]MDY7220499.1 hypothetical protein [Denitrificimonas sp. JX-1]
MSQRSIKERGVFLSTYDVQTYTNDAGKDLGCTVQRIAVEHTKRRKQSVLDAVKKQCWTIN